MTIIMTSLNHVILLRARLMHLFQLQPCLYQDVFHGSMAPYLHFNGFHANFLDHNNQTVSFLVCLYSDLRKIWILILVPTKTGFFLYSVYK